MDHEFKVGDRVTWSDCFVSYLIEQVHGEYAYLDGTTQHRVDTGKPTNRVAYIGPVKLSKLQLLVSADVSEWRQSPVREIIRKEIVPGTYGAVTTTEATADGVRISFPVSRLSAEELRAAAAVFTELADALDSR